MHQRLAFSGAGLLRDSSLALRLQRAAECSNQLKASDAAIGIGEGAYDDEEHSNIYQGDHQARWSRCCPAGHDHVRVGQSFTDRGESSTVAAVECVDLIMDKGEGVNKLYDTVVVVESLMSTPGHLANYGEWKVAFKNLFVLHIITDSRTVAALVGADPNQLMTFVNEHGHGDGAPL
jgi:hypothetical protein